MQNKKKIISTLAVVLLPFAAAASSLEVNVGNINTPEGIVRIGLYTADGYKDDIALDGAETAVTGDSSTVTFSNVEPGEYGIKLFHDIDNNSELNSNRFGVPTEPYAFSNNARGRFGPARWRDVKFVITEEASVQNISLN